MGHPASFAATENHMVYFAGEDCFAGFADPDSSQFVNVSGNYLNNGSTFYKTVVRTVKFAEGLGDGIEEMGAVIRSYIDDPDKLFESGETLANTALTLTTLLAEGPVATAAGIALLVEMTVMMWNSPDLIHYSDNKEDVVYDSGNTLSVLHSDTLRVRGRVRQSCKQVCGLASLCLRVGHRGNAPRRRHL